MPLKNDGERFILGESQARVEADHMERYQFAAGYVKKKHVLDIACGSGFGSNILAEAGAASVTGVDISQDSVDYAKIHFAHPHTSYKNGNIVTFTSNTLFDVIVCFETIEHIDDYKQALKNLNRLLQPSGLLIISSPNRLLTSPEARAITDKPRNKWHVREFTVPELKVALVKHGFSVGSEDVFGQRLQPYFKLSFFRKLYAYLVKPHIRLSAKVRRFKKQMPRYFILVGRKK